MGTLLSLILGTKPKFVEDITLGEEVIVTDLLSQLWNEFVCPPVRAKVIHIYGHGIYDVQLLGLDYTTPTFGVIRAHIKKVEP